MGNLYPTVTFEQLGHGDVLISLDEKVEWEVYDKHEAVPGLKIGRQIVTTIIRAEKGSGLAGLLGCAHILLGGDLSGVRLKKKGG